VLPVTARQPVVRPATPADAAAIRELLKAASLPIDDLDHADVQFWVAGEGSDVAGAIGLERSGSAGLVRSLVVTQSSRGAGLGRALVALLEREAEQSNVDELVLLTQTAEAFFTALGYAPVDRSSVPEGLRALEEFRSLCPASAVCLQKRIGPASHS